MKLWYKKMKAAGWEKDDANSNDVTLMKQEDNITSYITIIFKPKEENMIIFMSQRLNMRTNEVETISTQINPYEIDGLIEAIEYFELTKGVADDWYKQDKDDEQQDLI